MNHAIHLICLLLASIFCLSYLFSWLLAWGRISSFVIGTILVLLVNNAIVNGGVENACIEAGIIRNESNSGEAADDYQDDDDKSVEKKSPLLMTEESTASREGREN